MHSYDWWARHAEILRVQEELAPEIVLIGIPSPISGVVSQGIFSFFSHLDIGYSLLDIGYCLLSAVILMGKGQG